MRRLRLPGSISEEGTGEPRPIDDVDDLAGAMASFGRAMNATANIRDVDGNWQRQATRLEQCQGRHDER